MKANAEAKLSVQIDPPKCYADKSPDYDPSNDMTEDEMDDLVKSGT